jgi:hypothetical protein
MVACALLGPVLFLAILTIAYGWASGYCQHVTLFGQLATVLFPTFLTVAAAANCLHELRKVREVSSDDAPLARARLVARIGLLLNAFSTFLLLGLALPVLLLRPCD